VGRPNAHRPRGGSRTLVLVIVAALLPALLVGLFIRDRHERQAGDRNLAFQARTEAAALESYFARSRALTTILSLNPAFGHFYSDPGSREAKVAARTQSMREAEQALASLERLFPGSIGEACFIDRTGPENARAVSGQIAPLSDLSPDETGASFFEPTFALPPGTVYQSKPYKSPDTHDIVVANATPIPSVDGRKPAIVHFEISLASFRAASAFRSRDTEMAIVDATTGRVLLGSERGTLIPTGSVLDALARSTADADQLTLADHRASFDRVVTGSHNANRWLVVAVSRAPEQPFLAALGMWEILMLFGLFVLIVAAALGWRSERLELDRAANSDGLTGLGNRRRLMADFAAALGDATEERPLLLAFFDLDGFKAYNDAYGHPAGDALLARFGRRLALFVGDQGTAYRMGGDEFCVLAFVDGRGAGLDLVANAAEALSERGEGFVVTSSWGAALLPLDAAEAEGAFHLADERMYAQKSSSRSSASSQSASVLMRVVSERDAELGDHLSEVASLAETLGRRFGLAEEEIIEMRRAAALHDIGKVAIPQAILDKPGPLDQGEWDFIRHHPLIGERIMLAAPSLARSARLVRSSHEFFDGSGYPDRLRGQEIPLGARIIAVCDAFEAMTSDRPYHERRARGDALAELRRCAGTQFDPEVVEAFAAALAESAIPARSS
jgi:diguanylate cyclase (GGDEF)-like protein